MRYIITESQDDYLNRWNKFVTFMKRRHTQILEIIDYNINQITMKKLETHVVINWVMDDFLYDNDIDSESEIYEWIKIFLTDNYSEIIGKKIDIKFKK